MVIAFCKALLASVVVFHLDRLIPGLSRENKVVLAAALAMWVFSVVLGSLIQLAKPQGVWEFTAWILALLVAFGVFAFLMWVLGATNVATSDWHGYSFQLKFFSTLAVSGGAFVLVMNLLIPPAETDPRIVTGPAPMDSSAPSDTERYSLEEAARKGLIEYNIRGTGGSSGPTLLIGVRRTSQSSIDVYLRPGTVLASNNAKAQRMVVWGVHGIVVAGAGQNQPLQPVTSMYLPDLNVRTYILEAYCMDFELDNPSLEDRFEPVMEASAAVDELANLDVRAAQVIYEAKRRKLSVEAIQTAIWVDKQHLSKQEIKKKFEASDQDMDAAFEMLKRLPPPDLKRDKKATIPCQHEIQRELPDDVVTNPRYITEMPHCPKAAFSLKEQTSSPHRSTL